MTIRQQDEQIISAAPVIGGGFFVRVNASYCAISTETPMKTHDLPIEKKVKKSWLTPFT